MTSAKKIRVYVEASTKRAFAGAIDWPGWCRSGKDEAAAMQALFDYAPRYARVMRAAKIEFTPPADVPGLAVVERLTGNTTTDFGAPDASPAQDENTVDEAQLQALHSMLRACWKAFDEAARKAAGKELRKGPRGGGRDLEVMRRHVREGEGAYISRLGWKAPGGDSLEDMHMAALEGLAASARGEIPARGPRGGLRWTPRYFVRRAAWHVLDHAWEIEDRMIG